MSAPLLTCCARVPSSAAIRSPSRSPSRSRSPSGVHLSDSRAALAIAEGSSKAGWVPRGLQATARPGSVWRRLRPGMGQLGVRRLGRTLFRPPFLSDHTAVPQSLYSARDSSGLFRGTYHLPSTVPSAMHLTLTHLISVLPV